MKNYYLVMLVIISCSFLNFTVIEEKNENEKVEIFLIEMSDARMMDLQEGMLATEKGTTQVIKDYGNLMVKDQSYLLNEIKKFAKSKNIVLPTKISDKKLKALTNLKEKKGRNFDKKFLKMITIDHKRDVIKFKKATSIGDQSTEEFAKKNLPMIESHLQKALEIKKNY